MQLAFYGGESLGYARHRDADPSDGDPGWPSQGAIRDRIRVGVMLRVKMAIVVIER